MLEGPQEGRNDPSPNPYHRESGKPTHSYTGQHTLILVNKVQGSAGKEGRRSPTVTNFQGPESLGAM